MTYKKITALSLSLLCITNPLLSSERNYQFNPKPYMYVAGLTGLSMLSCCAYALTKFEFAEHSYNKERTAEIVADINVEKELKEKRYLMAQGVKKKLSGRNVSGDFVMRTAIPYLGTAKTVREKLRAEVNSPARLAHRWQRSIHKAAKCARAEMSADRAILWCLKVGGLATTGLLARDLYRWKSSH